MVEPPDEAIGLIEGFTEPGSEQRARLLEAADEIPITDIDEIQEQETNQVIGRRIFERELGDEFRVAGMAASPKSTWIREHLEDVDEDYLYRMWKRFAWFVAVEIPEYDAGGYDDLRQHIWKLDEVGLVEITRVQENPVGERPDRHFYGAVDAELDNDAWENVTAALYE